jgi:hypothetical protein
MSSKSAWMRVSILPALAAVLGYIVISEFYDGPSAWGAIRVGAITLVGSQAIYQGFCRLNRWHESRAG